MVASGTALVMAIFAMAAGFGCGRLYERSKR
jgi:hypothetical protein